MCVSTVKWIIALLQGVRHGALKKGEAPGELWSPYAVAIDSNSNYIYVAEGHPFGNFPRISIFSDAGEFLDSCTHEHMNCPEGIANSYTHK